MELHAISGNTQTQTEKWGVPQYPNIIKQLQLGLGTGIGDGDGDWDWGLGLGMGIRDV